MASQVAIYNMALAYLGQKPVTDVSGTGTGLVTCNVFYENTRDSVIAMAEWTFAIARLALAQNATSPDFGWSYAYQLPGDFIEPVEINEGTEPEWVIEGRNILTNEDEVNLVYLFKETNTGNFPPLFVDCLAVRLAADICPSLTRNFKLQQNLYQLFDLKLKVGRSVDAARGFQKLRTDLDPDNYDWLSCR